MAKQKYTPEELKIIRAETLRKNKKAAEERGYTQKSAAREKAIEEGKKTYTSSNPCKNCGSYERYVSTYACAPCTIKSGLEKLNNEELMAPYRIKEKQKKRLNIWRKKNPERYQKQYKNDTSRQRSREYYHDNKDKLKDNYLQKKYGITLESYNSLLEEQDQKCKICNTRCSTGKSLAVDHNHETEKIRGLLCKNCNVGLGLFFDNINLLESAILYLKSN
jgi:hypothetical protein